MFEETTTTTKVLEVANVASSTWYKSKSPEKKDQREFNKGRPLTIVTKKTDGRVVNDSEVIDALKELRSQQEFHSAGGYQKLKHYLYRRYEFHINKKKVYRLCRDNGLLLSKKKKSPKINSPISINRIITGPLQLWELDIKYGFIHGENRFFFLMAIIDVYLRYIVGYHIGLQCLASDLALTLKMALVRMGINDESSLVIRSDNGPQMTSNHFLKFIESNKNSLMHELI